MPKFRATQEPLCKGGCGHTVRETLDDCGTCRRCLAKAGSELVARKRNPDSKLFSDPRKHNFSGTVTLNMQDAADRELFLATIDAGNILNPDTKDGDHTTKQTRRPRRKPVATV